MGQNATNHSFRCKLSHFSSIFILPLGSVQVPANMAQCRQLNTTWGGPVEQKGFGEIMDYVCMNYQSLKEIEDLSRKRRYCSQSSVNLSRGPIAEKGFSLIIDYVFMSKSSLKVIEDILIKKVYRKMPSIKHHMWRPCSTERFQCDNR